MAMRHQGSVICTRGIHHLVLMRMHQRGMSMIGIGHPVLMKLPARHAVDQQSQNGKKYKRAYPKVSGKRIPAMGERGLHRFSMHDLLMRDNLMTPAYGRCRHT